MDALELLRLEAETIWGRDRDGLGSGTVFATATTYDGRTELLDGHADAGPETPTAADRYKGRGLAPVVVRAWATLLTRDDKVLFYSALEDNKASHRVATKCGAKPLGMLCRLGISG